MPRKTSSGRKEISKICFVISPIGGEGTDLHKKFKDVLDYIVRPSVEESGYDLKVIRSDDIQQSGSIIKDILQSLLDAHIVIADLTNQNPNVFYELGVRHGLKPRTILISEKADDIPFDLSDYRTIIYENSAKGVTNFKKKLKGYLEAIEKDPERPDNPVLDRLGSIIESNIQDLELENLELKKRLESSMKSEAPGMTSKVKTSDKRVRRILALIGAERQTLNGSFTRKIGEKTESFSQPGKQGNFDLYYVMPEGKSISYSLYLSAPSQLEFDEEFADMRVLLQLNAKSQQMFTQFVIATDQDLSKEKKKLQARFAKMLKFIPADQRLYFSFEIWDRDGLLKKERDLGLKI